MNVKAISLILTLILFLFGGYFLLKHFQTCYQCDPSLIAKTTADKIEKPEIIFAIANFTSAIFSVGLMIKGKFSISAIICGIVAGLQVAAIGTILILRM